jgi:hypothetical protein
VAEKVIGHEQVTSLFGTMTVPGQGFVNFNRAFVKRLIGRKHADARKPSAWKCKVYVLNMTKKNFLLFPLTITFVIM